MYVNEDEEDEFRQAVRIVMAIVAVTVIAIGTGIALLVCGVTVLLNKLSD